MPKVKAKVLAIKKDEDGKLLAKLQFNQRLPQIGEIITCKWGKSRSGQQNKIYWCYLEFLMEDCDLKNEYSNTDELHETLKATFLSKRVFHNGKEFIHVKSTTELDKLAFSEYLKQIDNAMVEYHHIDTSDFWSQYENQNATPIMEVKKEDIPF